MKSVQRRVVITAVLIVLLAGAIIPQGAAAQQSSTQPRAITGTYANTNPIYPTIGADHGILLYDLSGQILEDYAFVSPAEAQVIGTVEGDISSGTYRLELPDVPQGSPLDFDGDPSTPAGVQVFAASTYINFLGDQYINRGETTLDQSVRIEPMTYKIVGGAVIVWAADEGEQFPAGFGADGAAFTEDDPLMALPAGWSVVSLDTDPFTIIRDEVVEISIIESMGALQDYSNLGYVDAWNRLYERARETYPFTHEKHLDWDAIYREVTPIVKAATSDIEFHLAIAHFGELIPDTHIGYVSVPLLQQFLTGGVGISRLAVTSDGEVIITGVEPGSLAEQAGIQPYDVLTLVDGVDALKALDDTPMLLTSASTLHGRRYLQAATMLQGPPGSEVTLAWRSADGTEHTQTFTREFDISSLLAAFDFSSTERVVSARMLESGIGYINVRGFAEEVSSADEWFAQELQSLVDQGAAGIIIDVRNNTGGLVNLAMAMAGRFFPDYERLFDFYYADGAGGFAYRGFVEILAGMPYYEGPVAVLVNEMTGSAGDLFTYAMSSTDRAIIVGNTPTGGFTGEVSDGQYTLPGDLSIQIPTGRPVDPITGATLIEGVGVEPDIVVPITRDSLMSPEDEVLIAAEQAILAQ